VLFALGFLLAYWVVRFSIARLDLTSKESIPKGNLADQLMVWMAVGMVIGARLGHLLFYDFASLRANPMEFFLIREGGLASHGGAVGMILALLLFYFYRAKRTYGVSFLQLLDLVALPAGLVGGFIRMGNFVNQEILGTPTQVKWAVIFGHPFDGSPSIACHPVQLYEAACYFALFGFLFLLNLRLKSRLPKGICSALFLTLCFIFRFWVEQFKVEEGVPLTQLSYTNGQLLSLPLIFLGLILLFFSLKSIFYAKKTIEYD